MIRRFFNRIRAYIIYALMNEWERRALLVGAVAMIHMSTCQSCADKETPNEQD